MAGFRQTLDEVFQFVLDASAMAELVVEVGEFALRGQLSLEQEPGRFLKAAFAGQGFDRYAPVLQPRPLAVDIANRRLRTRHVRQARPILQLAAHNYS